MIGEGDPEGASVAASEMTQGGTSVSEKPRSEVAETAGSEVAELVGGEAAETVDGEAADEEDTETAPKRKRLKKKEMKAILEMDMTFKRVSFGQALTKEEKRAKRAARIARWKERKEQKENKEKKKKERPAVEVITEKEEEVTEEKQVEEGEETKEGEEEAGEKEVKEEEAEKIEQAGKKKAKKKVKPKEDEEIPKKTDEKRKKKEKKGKEGKAKDEVAGVQEEVAGVQEEVAGVQEEVAGVQEEVAGIQEEVTGVQEEVAGVQEQPVVEGADEKPEGEEEAKPEVAETEVQPEVAEEKAEKKKKPKRKKGKKKSVAETTTEGEGEEPKEKDVSEALTTEEEGDVSAKAKKQKKKKKKKGKGVAPSETTAEGEELGETEKVGRKKKAVKKEKQLEEKRTSRVSVKARTSSSAAPTIFGGSAGTSLVSIESSSSSEEAVEKKEKKRKKGKKQKKVLSEEEKEKIAMEKEEKKKAKEEKRRQAEEAKEMKKKKKKKGDETETVEETDIMAEIRRMKALAEAQATGGGEATEEKEEPSSKKKKKKKKGKGKKGPKKKLTKKQKALLAQEQAEKARIQAELEAQRLIEEEKKRIQEERKMAKEKDKRETAEQGFRNEQLAFSTGLIKAMLDQNWSITDKERKEAEWAQYLKCDGLPDPINPPQMNTYLHLWEQVINDVTVEEVVRRTNEVLKLLETLQDYMDDPFDVSESLVADWKWIRGLCRDHQKETLNMATYRLLRDIDSRLNRIDIPTADFNISDKDFNLCLYVLVQLPTPMYNPRNISKTKLEIDFSDINMKIVYPLSIDTKYMATRAMYLRFDHLSDTCGTYDPFLIPTEYELDLLESTSQEWYKQLLYKYENRKRPEIKTVEDEFGNMVEIEPPPEPELVEGELPPIVPFQILEPPAPEYVIDLEDKMYANNRADVKMEIVVEENVLNLRKYMIIGGVYYLELFYQPPQPKDLVAFEIRLTALKLPKRLEEVPVYIEYEPPPPEDPLAQKTPEELEQDVKQQEEILESLISITVTLPEHVMFLDLPVVCQWDSERKVWTTQDVIDLKHVEEQNYITFRTGLFGPFALAVNRYLNFPFQMWEIKPETDGTVTFQLTCAILMIEFNIKSNTICLTQLQNGPNNALQDIIGVYFKLPKLITILRSGGVDIFPAYDAFKYVEGVCEKQWPIEKHTYYSMGLLSCTFNFNYSRWNNQAGRRKLVMQMREYHPDKTKQRTHNMLVVTPLNAIYIDCTEVSTAFNETPTENMKFCSDVFHLMKATCSISTRNKVLNGPQDVAKALGDVLIATRILSFSA